LDFIFGTAAELFVYINQARYMARRTLRRAASQTRRDGEDTATQLLNIFTVTQLVTLREL